MSTVKVNISGINELDFPTGVSSATTTNGITTINLENIIPVIPDVHDEPLTDGNANFIFDATLLKGGDIIVVTGVPN